MKEDITTIKLGKSTVRLLSRLKIQTRQSYEEVILELNSKDSNVQISRGSKGIKGITTIKLKKRTVSVLSKLKIHPRQSYEEVILGLIKKRGEYEKK
jgi:predicted CopG family antitoxin